jgi:hypothetical protein
MGTFEIPARAGLGLHVDFTPPEDCKSGQKERVPTMIDTKVILALALLLSTLKIGSKPPAGGIPIPPTTSGSLTIR